MERKRILFGALVLALVLVWMGGLTRASGPATTSLAAVGTPLGTAFTYQGQLKLSGSVVNGTCDLQLSLWDAASGVSQVGTTLTRLAVPVTNGLFTLPDLDFGAGAFAGEARWLQLGVRCPAGSGTYATISARQALTAAPYALYATGGPWSGLAGVPAGFADNVDDNTTYTAGPGLGLTGTQFDVSFAGSGSADTAARSDHSHASTPWSSLSGVPAGFADDVDNDTTYTAGAGLALASDEFSVQFGGSGSADTAARSDHTHASTPWSSLSGVPAGFADDVDDDTTYTAGAGLTLVSDEFSVSFSGNGSADTAARSDHAHAASPVLNLKRVAMLRWYQANEAGNSFSVGVHPHDMVFDGEFVWVANNGSGTVSKIQPSDGSVLATYAAGSSPMCLAYDGAYIWATNQSANTVTKLQASTGVIAGTYPVGIGPRGIAFDGANIWVANFNDYYVTKLLASDGSLLGNYWVGAGSPDRIAFDGAYVWVTMRYGDVVVKMQPSDGTRLGSYAVGSGPEGVCFDGANIWVANVWGQSVTKLQASDGTVLGTYPLGNQVWSILFDGSHIWASVVYENNLKVLDPDTGDVVGVHPVPLGARGLVFDGANIWASNYSAGSVQKF